MKPAPFRYYAPTTIGEALAYLSQHGWDAKVLAGGQSLIPTMNDENGQPLNASLADYLIPTAMDVPRVELAHENTPSPFNPPGSKEVGEGGTLAAPALFAQALENALYDRNLEVLEMPLSPNRLFELLQRA